jgi:hypothetical protein
MATTTKKSTKAKTKTTKAVSAKKPATKKTAVSAKATAATSTSAPSILSLRKWHIVSAVVFVLLAILAGVMMSSQSYQTTVGLWARDDLASTTTTVFAPAVHVLYDVELRWIVVATMLVSAILPVLYVTKLEGAYTNYLRTTRMVPYRWLDLGVTTALMVETIALLSGVQDIFVLKLVGSLMLVTSLLGLIAERQNNASDRPVWSAYATSLFSGVMPWVLIAAYAVSTNLFGAIRSPWYVYALYATSLIGFSLIALNQRQQFKKAGGASNYLMVERNYVVASVLTKVAFAAILIVGVAK